MMVSLMLQLLVNTKLSNTFHLSHMIKYKFGLYSDGSQKYTRRCTFGIPASPNESIYDISICVCAGIANLIYHTLPKRTLLSILVVYEVEVARLATC